MKMAINSQLSKTVSKKQTKQTRIGTESQIWRSFGGLSVGGEKGKNEEKGLGIKKYKLVSTKLTGGWMVRTVQEMEQPKNLHA